MEFNYSPLIKNPLPFYRFPMRIQNSFIFLGVLFGGCCDKSSLEQSLHLKLDSNDPAGAVEVIDHSCLSKNLDFQATKAVLLFAMSMDQEDPQERKRLRAIAVTILERANRKGSLAAGRVLNLYREQGEERFLHTFPWGHLLGEETKGSRG